MRLRTGEEFPNNELKKMQQKLKNLAKFSVNSESLEEL